MADRPPSPARLKTARFGGCWTLRRPRGAPYMARTRLTFAPRFRITGDARGPLAYREKHRLPIADRIPASFGPQPASRRAQVRRLIAQNARPTQEPPPRLTQSRLHIANSQRGGGDQGGAVL